MHCARRIAVMDWQALLSAFALYLVLEGILPFLSPLDFKRAVLQMCALKDRALRVLGGGMIAAGLALLHFVR